MREKEGEKQYSEYSTYILGGGGGAASKKYYGIHRYTVAINPHKPYPKSEFNSSLAVVVVVVLIMLCRRWPGTGVTGH